MDLHNKMMEFPHESIEFRKARVLDFLKEHFETNGDEIATKTLVQFARESFFAPYYRKWKSVDRNNDRFRTKFDFWLIEEITFPDDVLRSLSYCSSTISGGIGRPSKSFEDCSLIRKRRKTEQLRKDKSISELSFATAMKLREAGNEAAANLLMEATTTTPTQAKQYLRAWKTSTENQFKLFPLI